MGVPELATLQYPEPNINATVAWFERLTSATCQTAGQDVSSAFTQPFSAFVPEDERTKTTAHQSETFTVVTGGSNFDPAAHEPTLRNQRCYCAQHGIRLHHVDHDFLQGSTGVHPMFNKMLSLLHGLETAPMDSWVVWVDRDILFSDMSVHIKELVKAAYRRRTTPADCHVVVRGSFEAGIFFVRKSCWAMRFLRDWWSRRNQCSNHPPEFDQVPFLLSMLGAVGYVDQRVDGKVKECPKHMYTCDLLDPQCHRWVTDINRHTSWGKKARGFITERTTRAWTRICPFEGSYMNSTTVPWNHFLGQKAHPQVRQCFRATEAHWRKHSSAHEACATFKPSLVPPCARSPDQNFTVTDQVSQGLPPDNGARVEHEHHHHENALVNPHHGSHNGHHGNHSARPASAAAGEGAPAAAHKSGAKRQAGRARSAFLAHCSGEARQGGRLVVLDVGANNGNSSLSVVRQCSKLLQAQAVRAGDGTGRPTLKLILVEPNPTLAADLASAVDVASKLEPPWHTTVVPSAASTTENGHVSFWRSPYSLVSSLRQSNAARWNRLSGAAQKIDVTTLDLAAFLARNVLPGDVAYLKLDVESAEWNVVPHLLRRGALCPIRYLLIEWHYKGGGANRTLATSLEAELRQGCGSDGPRVVEHESDVPMLLAGADF